MLRASGTHVCMHACMYVRMYPCMLRASGTHSTRSEALIGGDLLTYLLAYLRTYSTRSEALIGGGRHVVVACSVEHAITICTSCSEIIGDAISHLGEGGGER